MARIYLDWNATAPLRPQAKAAAVEALEVFGNPSSIHEEGRRARKIREDARERIAVWLKVSPESLTFTSGGTESNAVALHGLAARLSGGKAGEIPHLAVTAAEHPSVLEPAKALAAQGRVRLTLLRVTPTGLLDLDFLRELIRKDPPGVLSVQAANNETGAVQPLTEVSAFAREAGARLHVDATQIPGRLPLPGAASGALWGADFVTLSGHKIGALKGVGVLVNPRRLPFPPLISGGPQERGRRAGTENLPAIASFGAAAQALAASEAPEIAHLGQLDREFLELLGGSPFRLNSGDAPRLPNTWNLRLNEEAEPVLQALDLEGIAVSSGSACSSGSVEPSPVLLAMGLSPNEARASLRVSAGRLTTTDELAVFFETLGRITSRSR